jgi:hypothetical protein
MERQTGTPHNHTRLLDTERLGEDAGSPWLPPHGRNGQASSKISRDRIKAWQANYGLGRGVVLVSTPPRQDGCAGENRAHDFLSQQESAKNQPRRSPHQDSSLFHDLSTHTKGREEANMGGQERREGSIPTLHRPAAEPPPRCALRAETSHFKQRVHRAGPLSFLV